MCDASSYKTIQKFKIKNSATKLIKFTNILILHDEFIEKYKILQQGNFNEKGNNFIDKLA